MANDKRKVIFEAFWDNETNSDKDIKKGRIKLPEFTTEVDENGMRAIAVGILIGLMAKYKHPSVSAFYENKDGDYCFWWSVDPDCWIFKH